MIKWTNLQYTNNSDHLVSKLGWSVGLVCGLRVGGHPALSLHSSNEPGELSQ